MGRTINRRPMSVNVPSGNDVKKYYFNQANWKGICTDKNYFNIDQETFEYASNIYMDEQAILKSRPAIKIYNYERDVVKYWTFDKLTVYLLQYDDVYKLKFVDSKIYEDERTYSKDVQLVAHDGKIWIFDNVNLYYYDGEEIVDGRDYVYVPVNTVVNDDVATLQKEDNVLTTSKINRYIYDTSNATYSSVYGKNVKVTLNDVTVQYDNFKKDYLSAILQKTKYKLTEKNFADAYVLGPSYEGKPLIDVAENGNMILCEYVRYTEDVYNDKINKTETLDKINWTIYFSNDGGNIFTEITTVNEILGMPILTRDGESIGILKEDGIYFIRPGDSVFRKVVSKFDSSNSYTDWPVIRARYENKLIGYKFNYNTSVRLYALSENNCFFYFGLNFDWCKQIEYKSNSVVYTGHDGTNYEVNVENWTSFPIAQSASFVIATNGVPIYTKSVLTGNIYPSPPPIYSDGKSYTYLDCKIRSIYVGAQGYIYVLNKTYNNYITKRYTFERNNALLLSGTNLYDGYFVITEPNVGKIYKIDEDDNNLNLVSVSNDSFAYSVLNDKENSNILKILTPTNFVLGDIETGMLESVNYTVQDDNFPIYLRDEFSVLVNKDDKYLYVSKLFNIITFDEIVEGEVKSFAPTYNVELDDWFFAKDKNLYISESKYNDDGEFLWNFPTKLNEQFTYDITNLHIISDNQVAVFFSNHVWVVTFDSENMVYRYNQSRLQVGCKQGNDIITSYDGSQTIFSTERGLVIMTYKDFVATTEQTLVYLSDSIYDLYKKYNESVVKLQKKDFWIYCYNENGNDCFVFDIRNNSWWYWQLPLNISNMYNNNELILQSDGGLYHLVNTDEKYYDEYYKNDILKQSLIDWTFTSQKLHLSTLNYYKNVENISINSVQENDNLASYNLVIRNYRDGIDAGETSMFEYQVEKLRTYVKWVNYGKLVAFQYTLNSDFDYAEKFPLSISSIIIKYKIGGVVR